MGRIRRFIDGAIGRIIKPIVQIEIQHELRRIKFSEVAENFFANEIGMLRGEVNLNEERINNVIGLRNDLLNEIRDIIIFTKDMDEEGLKKYINDMKIGSRSTMYQSKINFDNDLK